MGCLQCIPNQVFIGLPNPQNSDSQTAEEKLAMKSEGPEYGFVILLALEDVPSICKNYVIPVDIICKCAKPIQPIQQQPQQHEASSIAAGRALHAYN